jgi:hypothetical protein
MITFTINFTYMQLVLQRFQQKGRGKEVFFTFWGVMFCSDVTWGFLVDCGEDDGTLMKGTSIPFQILKLARF